MDDATRSDAPDPLTLLPPVLERLAGVVDEATTLLGAVAPHLPSLLALAQEHAAVEAELRQVTPESVAKILGVTAASVELGASGDGAVRSGPWINVERLVRLRDHVGVKVTVLPRDRHSIDIEWG
jgi:hypothetical protein